MFTTLLPLKTQKYPQFKIDDIFEERIKDINEVYNTLNEIENALNTQKELCSLYNTIKQTGITKPLLLMTNNNGILSQHIKGIPSLESLTADISPENSSVALESIAEKIDKANQYVSDKLNDLFTKIRKTYDDYETALTIDHSNLESVLHHISGHTFNVEKSKSITGKFLTFESLKSRIENAKRGPDGIKELLAIKESDITETHASIFSKNKVIESVIERYTYNTKDDKFASNLNEAGYDNETVNTIAHELMDYFSIISREKEALNQELNNFKNNMDRLVDETSDKEKAKYTIGTVAAVAGIALANPVLRLISAIAGAILLSTSPITIVRNTQQQAVGTSFNILWGGRKLAVVPALKIIHEIERAYE